MTTDPLERAREALRQGDSARARWILVPFLEQQPRNAAGWRLLAQCVEKESETIYCLERALKLDPGDEEARQALVRLRGGHEPGYTGDLKGEQIVRDTRPVRVTTTFREAPQAEQVVSSDSVRKARRTEPLQLINGDRDAQVKPVTSPPNWTLAVGLVLVGLALFLAIAGPSLAPRDPLEEHNIFQIEGRWKIPPLNPLTPGYPLGTDNFGRDLYSRLLWAVRPTFVMVAIVAAVRLALGLLIGLLAGWLNGRPARALDAFIQAALSVPVLLVALGAIAAVGAELGLWAFILGLSLTGWVETAQQVREQTRIVKGQVYVEAAHAMGASHPQILLHHVLKQIAPMLVMLFSFEVSSTLMATAGLGFLGYYIGGDVWVTVSDFVARRISGMPELGQMLATSWVTLTRPWAMVAVGTLVFSTVLGFNLVGDGLRQGLNLNMRRRGIAARLGERAGLWFDQHLWHPVAQLAARPAVRTGLALATIAILIWMGGNQLLRLVNLERAAGEKATVTTESQGQAGSTTAGEEPAPASVSGQEAANGASPTTPSSRYEPVIVWEISDESGFAGGLALSADGQTLYAASGDGRLYALNPEGETLWRVKLPAGGVGTPALDAAGDIFAVDRGGGLNKVSAQGKVLWRFQSQAGDRAHSGPVLGPDGVAYYTVGTSSRGFVQAVSPDGQGLWVTPAETSGFFQAPELSATGEYVYLKEDVFSAGSGERVELESDFRINRFFAGQDGKDYLVSKNYVIEWQRVGQALEFVDMTRWSTSPTFGGTPRQAGVTAESQVWLVYTSPGGSTSLIWVTMDDQVLGRSNYQFSNGKLIARLPGLGAILCGNPPFNESNSECAAFAPDSDAPLWNLRLPGRGPVQGGLWLDGHLYLTTAAGSLLAIAVDPGKKGGEIGEPEIAAGEKASLLWQFRFDQPLLGNSLPEIASDGSVHAISENNRLYALNPDGTLRYQVDLPTGLFQMRPEEHVYGAIWPLVLPDGTVLIVSDRDTVYAINPHGELAWEQALAAPPAEWPTRSEDGIVYLVDERGGLTAIDANGLRWRFQPQAANRPANAAIVGPDGVVYYTVTDLSRGFVQAVSPDGQVLWVTQAETSAFYQNLQVSPDGSLVFLKDDVFAAETGELLNFETPVRVDKYLMGRDGRTYLQSGHSIIQWQLGPAGFEVVQTTSWDHSRLGTFPPLIFIDANQLYWVDYFQTLLWMRPDGRVLNTFKPAVLTQYDLTNSRITLCSHVRQSGELTCQAYAPGEAEPVWQETVSDVPDFDFGQARLIDGYLYVLVEGQRLYKYWIGEPDER